MQHHGGEQLTNGGVQGLSGGNGLKHGVVGWRPLDGTLEGPAILGVQVVKMVGGCRDACIITVVSSSQTVG